MKPTSHTQQLAKLVSKHIELQSDLLKAESNLEVRLQAEHDRLQTYYKRLFASEVKDSLKVLKEIFDELNPDNKMDQRMLEYRLTMYIEHLLDQTKYHENKKTNVVSLQYTIKDAKKSFYDKKNRVWHDHFPAKDHPLYRKAMEHALFYKATKEQTLNNPELMKLSQLMVKLERAKYQSE